MILAVMPLQNIIRAKGLIKALITVILPANPGS
jgi:hypothetical protein